MTEEIDVQMENGTLRLERWMSGDQIYDLKSSGWEEEVGRHLEADQVRRCRLGKRELSIPYIVRVVIIAADS